MEKWKYLIQYHTGCLNQFLNGGRDEKFRISFYETRRIRRNKRTSHRFDLAWRYAEDRRLFFEFIQRNDTVTTARTSNKFQQRGAFLFFYACGSS